MTVSKNGKPRPVQKFHRLCGKNDKYHSSKAREVKLLRDAFMFTVNTRQARTVGEGMTIVATTTGLYKKQVSLPALQNGMRLLEGNK